MKNWSRVLSYFRPELPRIWLSLLLMGLGIGANLLKPWPVALILDHIVAGRAAPQWIPQNLRDASTPMLLGLAALAIFLLHAAQGSFAAGQNYLSIKAGLRGLTRIRTQLFAWMQRLSIAFYQRQNQGDLIYRATWDTYSIQTIFQHGLFKFLSAFATIVLMVIVMWRVNVVLTLITVAVFPPLLGTMYFFGQQMSRRSLAAHQADSKVTSLVQQNIANLPVIQSFTRETDENVVFGKEATRSFLARAAQHRLEVAYWLVIAVLFGIATAALTWWGAREILAGRLTVGELVIVLSYLGQLYEPLNQLSHVGATLSDANAGTQRVFEILDASAEVPESANARAFPAAAGGGVSLEFAAVSFSYEANKTVLSNISFKVKAGETIGFVGPSGSGKTTLLNLLPRFYDPETGSIRVQEVELREIMLKDLRAHVALVFQETFLLPGSIAENIAVGLPGATRQQIEEAAARANSHEFIVRLPEGYDTLVGEGAARLSVGEKQRINIARAFLKNAPILLLDEPTSALDSETEGAILESLRKLMANRTTLMAAHRFGTLSGVDKIAVLERGAMKEFGTPEELLKTGGYYSRVASKTRS